MNIINKIENPVMIALDVGGTKADCVMFDKTGHIIARVLGKGSTPVDAGMELTKANNLDIIRKITKKAGRDGDVFYASIATADYYGRELQHFFEENLGASYKKVRVEEDGPSLISGMLGHKDGCSLISGTGSALYVRTGDSYYHLGGGGYLIDSAGSGYVLGTLALRAAFRSKEGWEEPTALVSLIESKCGETLLQHYTTIYAEGRSHIASFADTVFAARDMGDRVAKRIFDFCASELASLVWCVYKRLGGPFDLVYNGGIFYNHREYAEAVRALSPSDIHSVFSDAKPIYGAAVEAMYDAGYTCDADFKRRFTDEYNKLSV